MVFTLPARPRECLSGAIHDRSPSLRPWQGGPAAGPCTGAEQTSRLGESEGSQVTRIAKGKSITLHDAQQVTRFGIELRMVANLVKVEGHTRACAELMVWDTRLCTCGKDAKR